jgi:hypothetical protein
MKNFSLLCMLVVFQLTLHAQTSKGTFLIGFHNYSPGTITSDGTGYNLFPQTNGLGISFGSNKTKVDGELQDYKESTSYFGLSLNSHYFVADQFAIGLTGNFSSSSSTYKEGGQDDDKSSSFIFLVGPEMRYYFDAGTKTKIWIKGGAAVGSVSYKYNGESDDPTDLSQFGGGAGISIFPVPTVSIDFGLGYNVLNIKDGSDSFGEYKSINSSLAFDIGAGIFF